MFETIERTAHLTNMIREILILVSWRLSHVDDVIEFPIKESSLEIDLVPGPGSRSTTFSSQQRHQEPKRLKPSSWGENLIEINTLLLRVSHSYETCLEFVDGPIWTALGFEHPFGADDAAFIRTRNKFPGGHTEQRGEFFISRLDPLVTIRRVKDLFPRLGDVN